MRYRLLLLLGLLILVPLGYFIRFRENSYWSSTFGAIAYNIVWVLFVQLLAPKTSPTWTAIYVCAGSCVIEFLQLWKPPLLQAIRATWPGRLLLGNTFLWDDFPPYFVGAFLGWLVVMLLRRVSNA